MSDVGIPADPLRIALAEMRAELDGLIGREISRLLASGAETRGAGAPPARADEPRPRREDSCHETAELPSARPSGMGGRAAPTLALQNGEERADDAGTRLDALARRLEGRLLRPRGRAAESTANPPGASPPRPGEPDEVSQHG